MNIDKLRTKKDVKGLIKALKYKDSNVRIAATSVLKIIGVGAVPALNRALGDSDSDVRKIAAEVLGAIKNATGVDYHGTPVFAPEYDALLDLEGLLEKAVPKVQAEGISFFTSN